MPSTGTTKRSGLIQRSRETVCLFAATVGQISADLRCFRRDLRSPSPVGSTSSPTMVLRTTGCTTGCRTAARGSSTAPMEEYRHDGAFPTSENFHSGGNPPTATSSRDTRRWRPGRCGVRSPQAPQHGAAPHVVPHPAETRPDREGPENASYPRAPPLDAVLDGQPTTPGAARMNWCVAWVSIPPPAD